MPTYVYRCLECGEQWEENLPVEDRDIPLEGLCIAPVRLSFDNPPEECQGEIIRLPTSFTFSMKGSE